MWVNLFTFCCRWDKLFLKVSEIVTLTYHMGENNQFNSTLVKLTSSPALWSSFTQSILSVITFRPPCRQFQNLNTCDSKGNTCDSKGNVTAKAWHVRAHACPLSHDMTPFVHRHDIRRMHICDMTHARHTMHSHAQHDSCTTSIIIFVCCFELLNLADIGESLRSRVFLKVGLRVQYPSRKAHTHEMDRRRITSPCPPSENLGWPHPHTSS